MGGVCRYEPSCSRYARESIEFYGPWRGTILAIQRLASCHPFSRKAFLDPVPLNSSGCSDFLNHSLPLSSCEESCATRTVS